MKSVLSVFESERADFRPGRADLRPERTGFRPDRANFRPERALGTDGWTDGRTDEQKSPCVLQDFVPFGAAALLPLTPIYNHAEQGNGYRWPHIALGRPVFIVLAPVISTLDSIYCTILLEATLSQPNE